MENLWLSEIWSHHNESPNKSVNLYLYEHFLFLSFYIKSFRVFLISGASYYERLNDSENISSDEIRVISNPIPTDSNTAALLEKQQQQQIPSSKRSPLTRMKSDTLDVEKRAKFAKNAEIAGANFRPISMMNLVCVINLLNN